ncbi:tyrosine-type recombinase/integrase [Rhizobium binae]|uniref:tyrosine-type recombinase/integrase n=1 Tax=Rhizobium binae TaxID=1138190 RepID=UPI001C83ADEF|nr:tyrosine-type recombinase/integrase [Rhizobium binae]MBX4961374.1 site-specific integrase [Rhizobium binae]
MNIRSSIHGDGRPKAKADAALPPLYDLPQLLRHSDGRISMIDRWGFVMRPQTIFLERIRGYYATATYRSYARLLLDIERVTACYGGGIGLPYFKLSDAFLDVLREEYIQERETGLAHFKRTMSVGARFWKFCEEEKWAKGLYGSNHKNRKYQINVPEEGFMHHPVMAGKVIWRVPRLPTHRDFELIEAAGMTLIKTPSLKRRFRLFCLILKTLALRRSEAARLNIASIPTKSQIARLRAQAEAGKKPWTVSIKILRSKRGGIRVAEFPIPLLEEIRDYIDRDRPKDVKGSSKHGPIFVSRKTGKQLGDQWVTNLFKRAARKAAAMHAREHGEMNLSEVRPHHYRHRGITDLIRGYLEAGKDSTEAILIVMQLVGLRSLDVIIGYLHLAEAETEDRTRADKEVAEKRAKKVTLDLVRIREALGTRRRYSK